MAGAKRQVPHKRLDSVLAAWHVLQPVLVAPEDIVDGHVDPAPLQVNAGQAFQVLEADKPLHRLPDLVVDLLRPCGEEHEDQVAQQVGLGEVDASRIERLEDAVCVVSRRGGDVDNR